MDESNTSEEAPFDSAAPSVRRFPRWPTMVAWIAIALLVAVAVVGQQLRPRDDQPATSDEPGIELTAFEWSALYVVGSASVLPPPPTGWYVQIKALNTGTVAQRLRFIVLAGELAGPQEALDKLEELRQKLTKNKVEVPTDLAPVPDLLRRIFENRQQDQPPDKGLSDAEREVLTGQLGWFGELALHPKVEAAGGANGITVQNVATNAGRQAVLAPARRFLAKLLGGIVLGGGVGLLGLVGLVFFIVTMKRGLLTDHFAPPGSRGGIYAETFAVWLFMFLALGLAPLLLTLVGVPEVPDRFHLLASGMLSFLSLAALAWPCLRGIPWTQVRRDIGWTTGRGLAIEPLAGLGAYLMTIPLVGLGMLLTTVMMRLQQVFGGAAAVGEFDRTVLPSHPIVPMLAEGDRWLLVQALFLASVAAPIIEETAFRGVLYRHLREATGRWGRMQSFLGSTVFNGVIFALIHPQGLVAVPALTCVAAGLTLAREWRGTLLPSIILHGVHNGLLLLLTVALFS